jgi:hypothetical protein
MRRLTTIGTTGILAAALLSASPANAQFTGVSVGLSFGLWDGVGVGFYGSSWDGPYSDGFFFGAGYGLGYVGSHGIYTDYGQGWTHWSHRAGYWRHPFYYSSGYGASSCWVDVWEPYWDPWYCTRPVRSTWIASNWWRPVPRVMTSVYWRDPFWDPWGPYYGPSPVYVYGGSRGWYSGWYPRVGTRVVWSGRPGGSWRGGYASPTGYKAPATARTASARPRAAVMAPTTRSSTRGGSAGVSAPRVTRPLTSATPTTRSGRPQASGGSVRSVPTRSSGTARSAPARSGGAVRTSPTGRSGGAAPVRSSTGRLSPTRGSVRSSPTAGAVRSAPSRSAGTARVTPSRNGGVARTSPTSRAGAGSAARGTARGAGTTRSAVRSSPTGGAARTAPSRSSGTARGAVRTSPTGRGGSAAAARSPVTRTTPSRGTARTAPSRSGAAARGTSRGSSATARPPRAPTATRSAPARSGSRAPAARSSTGRTGTVQRAPARSGGTARARAGSGSTRRRPGG